MTPFERAVLLHLIGDWVLQNDWIALNKYSLRHHAAWVHGAMHALLMVFVFPVPLALGIGVTHMLIDTRVPARFWSRFYKGASDGPYKVHVAVWLDQVFHLMIMAALMRFAR